MTKKNKKKNDNIDNQEYKVNERSVTHDVLDEINRGLSSFGVDHAAMIKDGELHEISLKDSTSFDDILFGAHSVLAALHVYIEKGIVVNTYILQKAVAAKVVSNAVGLDVDSVLNHIDVMVLEDKEDNGDEDAD